MNKKYDYDKQGHAWSSNEHARVFDYMANNPNFLLKKHYELFNETRFLKHSDNEIKGDVFFEIGCATGELYRYLSNYLKRFKYHGFDVSKVAVDRAKEKYGERHFTTIVPGEAGDVEIGKHGKPDVVFCRDVVIHQEHPYEFLDGLIQMANEAIFLRLRTRDQGATVFDPTQSCQLHWDKHWEPYIVLNIDEMINRIKKHRKVDKIIIGRRYEPLGGHNFRYLPKELYFTDAGSAETAVYIHKGEKERSDDVTVIYRDQPDGAMCYSSLDMLLIKLTRRAIKIFKKLHLMK